MNLENFGSLFPYLIVLLMVFLGVVGFIKIYKSKIIRAAEDKEECKHNRVKFIGRDGEGERVVSLGTCIKCGAIIYMQQKDYPGEYIRDEIYGRRLHK